MQTHVYIVERGERLCASYIVGVYAKLAIARAAAQRERTRGFWAANDMHDENVIESWERGCDYLHISKHTVLSRIAK